MPSQSRRGGRTPPASTLFASQTFTGSNGSTPAGWTLSSNGSANIQSNQLRLVTSAGGSYSGYAYARFDQLQPKDFLASVDITLATVNEQYVSWGFRGDTVRSGGTSNLQNNGYYIELIPAFNQFTVKRRTGGSSSTVYGQSMTFATNDVVHLEIRAAWDAIEIRAWLNSATRPDEPTHRLRDPVYFNGQSMWFGILGGNDAVAHTANIDNLTVYALPQAERSTSLYPFRGIGLPGGTNHGDIDTLNAQWWYDWGVDAYLTATAPRLAKYVPMIWGDWPTWPQPDNYPSLAVANNHATHLLTFNEPDSASQANMTYTRAADLWPLIEASGARLGSPATTSSVDGATWMDGFMGLVKSRGLRVDFICLHWYGNVTTPADFTTYVVDAFNKWGRPIWVTETSGYTYDRSQNATFATEVLARLRDLPFVERLAWFANRDGVSGYEFTGLLDSGGSLNSVGTNYVARGPNLKWTDNVPAYSSLP